MIQCSCIGCLSESGAPTEICQLLDPPPVAYFSSRVRLQYGLLTGRSEPTRAEPSLLYRWELQLYAGTSSLNPILLAPGGATHRNDTPSG